jgi:hypothetical protein
MNFMLKGIDLYIGRGPQREEIVAALVQATPLEREAIADYDSDAYADVIKFGKWAWLHEFTKGKRFSWKIDLEINEDTDFGPLIAAVQQKLQVEIAVPDEDSPIPTDMIFFSIDGAQTRISVSDSEFE